MKKSIKSNPNARHIPKSWDNVIQLSDLTIADCLRLYNDGYDVVIEDGVVVDLVKRKRKHKRKKS